MPNRTQDAAINQYKSVVDFIHVRRLVEWALMVSQLVGRCEVMDISVMKKAIMQATLREIFSPESGGSWNTTRLRKKMPNKGKIIVMTPLEMKGDLYM